DLGAAVKTIVEAAPDAIQLTVGQARLLQDILGPRKPAPVLRPDVANFYNPKLHDVLWSKMIEDPVEQALELDAACVVVNLLLLPNQPDLHAPCIELTAPPLPNPAAPPRPVHGADRAAQAEVRPLRHAAHDRAAGDAAQREGGRLH